MTISPYNVNQLVFILEVQCVFYEVEAEFLYNFFLILCLTTTPGQAVSGRSVATEARNKLRPVYVKIAVGEEEFGQNFLHIFRFLPLALFHQFSIFTFVFTATLDKKKLVEV